eukprot:TRINITY_DN5850_c0_g1_i1.p1 TRINITY_DN5850_c0_g1~~TRINITY_DN5850_c0_g1_i1.p1  ORF type:complete len:778 (+),score=102.73 TRINITY_DN5850_c0_g1_i1:47-2335(+)
MACLGCFEMLWPSASSARAEDAKVEAKSSPCNGIKPSTNIIAISDPGQDLDDEMAFIMMRTLVERGLINLLGVVTTLHPAFDRARLCRGTLDLLGLRGVPVAIGTDGGDTDGKHSATPFEDNARSYMAGVVSEASMTLEPGSRMLAKLYEKAEKKSVTLLVIASLRDVAFFLRDNEALFIEKTKEVVIQGGVKEVQTNGNFLEPDSSNNLTFDKEASCFVFKRCQELGVPFVFCSRWAAYAAKMPRGTYDQLAELGSSIGRRLRNSQRESIEHLWARAAVAEDDPRRKGLPARCDRSWFINTFCGGNDDPERTSADPVWDLVDGFMQYDSLALFAAVPSLRAEFFTPVSVSVGGTEHLVIGVAQDKPNLQEPKEGLMNLLDTGFATGLMLNHHFKLQVILVGELREDTLVDMGLSCAVLKTLFAVGAVQCIGIVAVHPQDKAFAEADPSKTIRETLDEIGLRFVPVHVAKDAAVAAAHLTKLYEDALPIGVTVINTATLSAIATFAESDPRLFHDKTQRVILMGGAGRCEHKPCLLEPDENAQNNLLDMDAANRFYKTAQDLSVPLVVLSRFAVQRAQLPRALFDLLKSHGGKSGQTMYENQRAAFQKLWEKANESSDSPLRGKLAARCDREWFLTTFCNGDDVVDETDIWSQISFVNVYGALALLVALPGVLKRLFNVSSIDVRATTHQVIGWSAEDSCVFDCTGLQRTLAQAIFYGCFSNISVYSLSDIPSLRLPSGEYVKLEMSDEAIRGVIPDHAAYC